MTKKKKDNQENEKKEESLLETLSKKEHRYYMVNVLAKRARALVSGEDPVIKLTNLPSHNPSSVAIEELKKGRLKVSRKRKE